MSCYHITYKDRKKVASQVTSKEEYLKIRGSEKNQRCLAAARKGDEKAKMRLAQFNYSGYYPDGMVKGSPYVSKAFGFDIDSPEDFERIAPLLMAEPERYGLLMMERSARNGGHLVMKRDVYKTVLENQVAVSMMLQCEMDTNAHDPNRVFFASSAEAGDLLYLSAELFADPYRPEEAEELRQLMANRSEELPQGAHNADKHYRPWTTSANGPSGREAGAQQPDESSKPEQEGHAGEEKDYPTSYMGIPYSTIIERYWQKYNQGETPMKSNRDVLTYELSYNLRHICGFDAELMDHVIPCYDGFPPEQKRKCILSALTEKRTHMPKKLSMVLEELSAEMEADNGAEEMAERGAEEEAVRFYDSLPTTMPKSIKNSLRAVSPMLAFPAFVSVMPVVGALATGVRLEVHGNSNSLNLLSYVAGDAASGKGSIDPVVGAWLHNLKQQDAIYLAQEEEYRMRKKDAKNKKEQPEEPMLPVRCLTLNNTVANLADRLGKTQGKHAISFTPEADSLAQQWKSGMSNYSIMLRMAYDASEYHREAKSLDAVNVHVENLRWNVVMMGTPDALYRVVQNYTDGFQSRLAIARTPDNTFTALPNTFHSLTPAQAENIHHVAELLTLLEGSIALPKLEAQGAAWLERVRVSSMKNYDRVRARQRFRVCVTTQRMVCGVLLCWVCDELIKRHTFAGAQKLLRTQPNVWKTMVQKAQLPSLLSLFDMVADLLLENNLYFFRDRIQKAMDSIDYCGSSRVTSGKNDNIYEALPQSFTVQDAWNMAIRMRGGNVGKNMVKMMLKNWKRQGLVENPEVGQYRKIG